jgi:hypothetical protein
MNKCAYLVNSTPKYYGLLPLHFTLVKRYAPWLDMGLFLATEQPDHPICQEVKAMGVELIPLKSSEAGFLESRAAALQQLCLSGRFRMVLPMQEDFLLEREADAEALIESFALLDLGYKSARLMPCPGPGGPRLGDAPDWAVINSTEQYGFTFQATVWQLDACYLWYKALCAKLEAEWPVATTSVEKRRQIEIRANFAENIEGQRFFWKQGGEHVGWKRAGPWSNAVYMSPWPYRPTAIVQGKLEPWAAELGKREGVPIVL